MGSYSASDHLSTAHNLTASLACGLDGIKNKVEPPQIFEGDVYAAKELPSVPASLAEATQRFEPSETSRGILKYGAATRGKPQTGGTARSGSNLGASRGRQYGRSYPGGGNRTVVAHHDRGK